MLDERPTGTGRRDDRDAHDHAMRLSIAVVVDELTALLGATAVAQIGGVSETRAVQGWADGRRDPQRPHVLRFALQLATMISSLADRSIARAWFHGSNPWIGDRVPLSMLRDLPLEDAQGPLLTAARGFAEMH